MQPLSAIIGLVAAKTGLDLVESDCTLALVHGNGNKKVLDDLKLPYRFANIPSNAKLLLTSETYFPKGKGLSVQRTTMAASHHGPRLGVSHAQLATPSPSALSNPPPIPSQPNDPYLTSPTTRGHAPAQAAKGKALGFGGNDGGERLVGGGLEAAVNVEGSSGEGMKIDAGDDGAQVQHSGLQVGQRGETQQGGASAGSIQPEQNFRMSEQIAVQQWQQTSQEMQQPQQQQLGHQQTSLGGPGGLQIDQQQGVSAIPDPGTKQLPRPDSNSLAKGNPSEACPRAHAHSGELPIDVGGASAVTSASDWYVYHSKDVIQKNSETDQSGHDEDDSFFDLTAADYHAIKFTYAKPDVMLMTSKMREGQEAASVARFPEASLRFLLPDGWIVQKRFGSSDTLQVAKDFLVGLLTQSAATCLQLYIAPPMRVFGRGEWSKQLWQLQLVPAANIRVRFAGSSLVGQYLKEEVMAGAQAGPPAYSNEGAARGEGTGGAVGGENAPTKMQSNVRARGGQDKRDGISQKPKWMKL